ncbi:hypothetical protein CPB83DRAFT_844971 [Crepidotus variabilis]|uniref:DUF7918 domain-containing protein n=1 Tax=Crepidotus variabilis TaxID=179855 RepID=A0A9P6JVI5_9AGAR|nr:hypothetical protein CPB83DRAFT_844971 [Crepidotus variabilis]
MPATRLKFDEYEAWIVIEDRETEVYNVENDHETKTVTCWIASEEGKNFTIYARKKHKKFGCVFKPSVDGVSIRGIKLLPSNTEPHQRKGVPTSSGTSKIFEFTRLPVTDDDTYLEQGIGQGVGEIRVDLHRATFVRHTKAKSAKFKPVNGLSQSYKVHEKAKKAMVHRVQCIKEINESHTAKFTSTKLEIVVSFVFRYRSLNMLQANGIAPRPTPPPEVQRTSSSKGKRKISQLRKKRTRWKMKI